MSANDFTRTSEPPVAHPLALELARIVATQTPPPRVLVLGVGSGRNLPVLLATGARVEAIEDDPARLRDVVLRFDRPDVRAGRYGGPYPFASGFAGALSTHALLHGSRATIADAISAVRAVLAPGGHFFTTLGSTRDPRYGTGRRLEANTFAASEGSEAGIPHVYFDETRARELFAGFELEALDLVDAAETAGRWAHSVAEARTLVHWFAHARVRERARYR